MVISLTVLKYFCLIQESDDEDDVIIESEEEELDSGYEMFDHKMSHIMAKFLKFLFVNATRTVVLLFQQLYRLYPWHCSGVLSLFLLDIPFL